ncbi:MAG: dihydroorotate dehydrogenase electron transfer subunit [Clostridia bacterium]|nr:dihydroorotate dehydrogenase electron transfer subunit [Clostridia bacterium]
MKDIVFSIENNYKLAKDVYKMTLKGDVSEIKKPGQFVNIALPGFYLRRPISVCDKTENSLTLIYKTVGRGTQLLSSLSPGEKLSVLTGLGNGYDLSPSGERPVLVGGGVGTPPLYLLAKELIKNNKKISVVLGFNTADEVFYEEEFRALGCEVSVSTLDGSKGVKGYVTNALPDNYTYFYACGPEPMLKALYNAAKTDGQISFEERMGCGFGACVGCTKKTKNGYKRVCKDGPVFFKEEILWEN